MPVSTINFLLRDEIFDIFFYNLCVHKCVS